MNTNTSCDGCVFAGYLNDIQNSCKLNRMDKIGYSIKDKHAVLNRFCNTYRPEDWLQELSVQESQDLAKTVLGEVIPRVGFFVVFDGNLENLNRTILDIKNQTIKARYVVVINDKVEFNNEIQEILINNFDFSITEYHIVQLIEIPVTSVFIIDEAFKHTKNGWVYICDSGDSIDTSLIEKIHNRINIEMKKLVIVEPTKANLSGMIFQTALFKFLNGNKTKVFNDENVDNSLFLDKIKTYSKQSDPETFITWREFNGQA